jgi:hypothetical protein
MSAALRQTTRWMFGLLCLSILLIPGWASAQIPIPDLDITVLNIPSSDPANIWVGEGNTITFRMQLSAPSSQDVTLNYATDYVTAFGGSDYVAINGSARIPAGSTIYDLQLQILDELVPEGEETFTLRFSNVAGALLRTPLLVTIHINANDEIGFNGFPGNYSGVSESDGSKRIYITYSGGTSQPVTVNYAVTAGTATAGSDFTPINGTVTFQDGWLFREINIPILEDGLNEGPETFIVTLSNPQGASLGAQTSYTVTIAANDLLGFTSSSVTVYEVGGQAQVQVRLNAPSAQEVRVNYSTAAGTALSGQDYTPVSGTLIFAPYETLKTITIPITTDGQNGEAAESFAVVLGSAVNAQYTKASSRIFVNIYDNCPPESCYQ